MPKKNTLVKEVVNKQQEFFVLKIERSVTVFLIAFVLGFMISSILWLSTVQYIFNLLTTQL